MFSEFSKILGSIIKVLIAAAVFGVLAGNGIIGFDFDFQPVIRAYQNIADKLWTYSSSKKSNEPLNVKPEKSFQGSGINSQLQRKQGKLLEYHIVSYRETLTEIAGKHHASVKDIIILNQLAAPYIVNAGQALLIPLNGVMIQSGKKRSSTERRTRSDNFSYHHRRKLSLH